MKRVRPCSDAWRHVPVIPMYLMAQGTGPVFDRGTAMFQLKDAVEAYFETASDEHQLVFQNAQTRRTTSRIR